MPTSVHRSTMSDLFDLSGRAALVTGSSRGIGKAIALALAEYGADVAVHCASAVTQAQRVRDEIEARGRRSAVIRADLTQHDAPLRMFEELTAALGPIDILTLNASVQIRKPWQEITHAEFDRQMAINVRASLNLVQLIAPTMIERGWGRILTVGSVQQEVPNPEMIAYAASKAAQLNMVRNLAKQLASHGVTVNNLAPGVIDTDRNAEALSDPAYREIVEGWIPAGYIGQAQDCVGAALLLCSNAGRYITGADLFVDGGMRLK
jgi:glucose 1-dehydrogenase